VPRDVMVVDKVPTLAAGKIDYPAVQRMATARTERAEVATLA
jgi:acyl-CoA synthetase (AMP-forming)/AMP-acid ligase II